MKPSLVDPSGRVCCAILHGNIYHEDGGSTFLLNVRYDPPNCMVLYPRRQYLQTNSSNSIIIIIVAVIINIIHKDLYHIYSAININRRY
jgi:hypothetical protein